MVGRLTTRQIETLSGPGRHADGDNLYLSISKAGSKSWVLFYRFEGKRREMGLGSAAIGKVSLAEARRKAAEARGHISAGRDPLEHERAVKASKARETTFGAFADEYLALHLPKFRNDKHKAQWTMTLRDYCAPIRGLAISEVDTEAVLKVLKPIWQEVPETAARIRGRIENIMDAARARGLYQGENPARWRGHLKSVLPARQRLTRGHHAAMAYGDLPAFMTDLRTRQAAAALALELCILTATRSGETLGAQWSEFDLAKGTWTIPKHRMKAGHEHRIPLTGRAIAIVSALETGRLPHRDHVFPGNGEDKPLSNMAMTQVLKRMKRMGITVHGFRSTFRDWASEQTSFPHETCEHALAHRISDKAEAAYRRGDQFEKRRMLMEAWAAFCQPAEGKVLSLSKASIRRQMQS
jgi:integrase